MNIKMTKSLAFGNVYVLNEIATRLNMDKILGREKQGKLTLWTVRQELHSLTRVMATEISVGVAKRILISKPHPSTQWRLNILDIQLPTITSIKTCKVKRNAPIS